MQYAVRMRNIPREWRDCLDRDDVLIIATQTTGVAADSEIVQIAILNTKHDLLLDTLVRPEGRIPDEASEIHGITEDLLNEDDARPWPAHHQEVQALLASASEVIFYNAEFGLAMLHQTAHRYGLSLDLPDERVRCAMLDYARFRGEVWPSGEFRWHRLLHAYRRETGLEGLKGIDVHVARADCSMVLALMWGVSIKEQPQSSLDTDTDTDTSDAQGGCLTVGIAAALMVLVLAALSDC